MAVKVCLGGTFNVLHDGHLALLARACREGDTVFIGLTGDAMASKSRNVRVNPYATRLQNLAQAAERTCPGKKVTIEEINDDMGPAATGDFDVIVVSEETVPGAERINKARELAGLRPMRIAVVEMVMGRDGERVSSSKLIGKDKQ